MDLRHARTGHRVKLIGTQPFTTSTTYDALDRVVTTYPDGEVVTTAYNAATQPVSLSMASGALPRINGSAVATTHTCNSADGKSTELGT